MDTYAIVLYFDTSISDKLKEVIKTIARLSGNHYMIDVKIPPHITIGTFFSDEPDNLIEAVKRFSKEVESFEVTFDELGAFEPRVLFASPIKDESLVKLNTRIHEALLNHFQPAENEYYMPTKWIPHCALAVRLDEEQFEKAKTVESKLEFPMIARVEKIGLAKCNPYQEIAVWEVSSWQTE